MNDICAIILLSHALQPDDPEVHGLLCLLVDSASHLFLISRKAQLKAGTIAGFLQQIMSFLALARSKLDGTIQFDLAMNIFEDRVLPRHMKI